MNDVYNQLQEVQEKVVQSTNELEQILDTCNKRQQVVNCL